jgi:hypothetical protein
MVSQKGRDSVKKENWNVWKEERVYSNGTPIWIRV